MVGVTSEPTCKEGSSKRTKGTHVKGDTQGKPMGWQEINLRPQDKYISNNDKYHEHLEAEPNSQEKKD